MKVTKYFLGLTCTTAINSGERNRFATIWSLRPHRHFFIVMMSSAYATVTFGCKNGFFGENKNVVRCTFMA